MSAPYKSIYGSALSTPQQPASSSQQQASQPKQQPNNSPSASSAQQGSHHHHHAASHHQQQQQSQPPHSPLGSSAVTPQSIYGNPTAPSSSPAPNLQTAPAWHMQPPLSSSLYPSSLTSAQPPASLNQQAMVSTPFYSEYRAKVEIIEGDRKMKRRFIIPLQQFSFNGVQKILESVSELSLEGCDCFYKDSEDDAVLLKTEQDWKEAEREFNILKARASANNSKTSLQEFTLQFQIISSADTPVIVSYPTIPNTAPIDAMVAPHHHAMMISSQQSPSSTPTTLPASNIAAAIAAAQQKQKQSQQGNSTNNSAAQEVSAPKEPKVHSFTLVVETNQSSGKLEIRETKATSQTLQQSAPLLKQHLAASSSPAQASSSNNSTALNVPQTLLSAIECIDDATIPHGSQFSKNSTTLLRKVWRFKNKSNDVTFAAGTLFTRVYAKVPKDSKFQAVNDDGTAVGDDEPCVKSEVKPGDQFEIVKFYKVPDVIGEHKLIYQLVWIKEDKTEVPLLPAAQALLHIIVTE